MRYINANKSFKLTREAYASPRSLIPSLSGEFNMIKLLILPVILALNLYAGSNNYFFDKDTVSFSAYDEILDSSYGPVAGNKYLSWQNKSINYLHEDSYIFKVMTTTLEHASIMTNRCKLSVIAYKLTNNTYSEIWEINNNNCSGSVDSTHTFFTTTQFGCCDAENVYTHYSMESGKLITKSTSAVCLIPNTKLRITYYGNQGCDTFEVKDTNIQGIIYLLNKDSILDKAYLKTQPHLTWSPEIKADFKDYNPKTGQLFTLIFNFASYKFYIDEHINKIIISQKSSTIFYK
jgi:hypothetical protein